MNASDYLDGWFMGYLTAVIGFMIGMVMVIYLKRWSKRQ